MTVEGVKPRASLDWSVDAEQANQREKCGTAQRDPKGNTLILATGVVAVAALAIWASGYFPSYEAPTIVTPLVTPTPTPTETVTATLTPTFSPTPMETVTETAHTLWSRIFHL